MIKLSLKTVLDLRHDNRGSIHPTQPDGEVEASSDASPNETREAQTKKADKK
jgi:hypothetical protein